jgi:hypothetical protein
VKGMHVGEAWGLGCILYTVRCILCCVYDFGNQGEV